MSRFQEEVTKYQKSMDKIGIKYDAKLFEKVAKGCGPSIYNKDSSSVSCGDPAELDRVKKNYLIKKLGLKDSPKLDEAIKEACETMGKSNRNKYRAIFYYLLCKKFKKSAIYK
jgi:hypothetical protein